MVVLASGHRVETPHYDKVTIHDRLEKTHHPPVEHDNTNTSDGSAGSTTIGTDDDGEKTWDVNSTFQHSDENKSPTEKASNSEVFLLVSFYFFIFWKKYDFFSFKHHFIKLSLAIYVD